MVVKAIKPNNVSQTIPDEVIEVFNHLIEKNMIGNAAVVVQSHAAKRIGEALGISQDEVFRLKYLDVEDIYRDVGWTVEYEGGNWREQLDESYFKFIK